MIKGEYVQVKEAQNPRIHQIGDTLRIEDIRDDTVVTCDGFGGYVVYSSTAVTLWKPKRKRGKR